jgi:hypothetical protein
MAKAKSIKASTSLYSLIDENNGENSVTNCLALEKKIEFIEIKKIKIIIIIIIFITKQTDHCIVRLKLRVLMHFVL